MIFVLFDPDFAFLMVFGSCAASSCSYRGAAGRPSALTAVPKHQSESRFATLPVLKKRKIATVGLPETPKMVLPTSPRAF